MGFLDAVGSFLGAKKQSRAINRASQRELQATQEAIGEQRRQFDTSRADFQPFRQAGVNALGRLEDPNASFMASPDYEFRRGEGMRAIEGSAAARGGAFSGNALKALNQYNSNLASGEFGNWWNRQAGLVDVGRNAAGTVANLGANAASNIGNALIGGGQRQAGYAYDKANSQTQALSNVLYGLGRYGQDKGWFDKGWFKFGRTPNTNQTGYGSEQNEWGS